MKYVKAIAATMAVLMLHPLLLSCSAKNKTMVVREDDPWYESVRIKLQTDKFDTEMLEGSVVSYRDGRLYHLYNLTNLADYDNYRRTVLAVYDGQGNILSSILLQNSTKYQVSGIKAIYPDDSSDSIRAVAEVFSPGSFETAVVRIDINSGEVNEVNLLRNSEGNKLELGDQMAGYGVSDVYIAGEYIVPVIYMGDTAATMNTHAYSFLGSKYQCELDFTGIPAVHAVEEFSYDAKNNTLLTIGHTYADGEVVLEFDANTGHRIKYEKYGTESGKEINLAEYRSVATGDLCKIDMLGNITAFDIQTREIKTVIDNNWYTPYFSDLNCDEVKLVSCTSDEAVIYSRKETGYTMFFSGMDETVTILKKSDKNPNAGKKVIELATPIDQGMTEYLSDSIYEFNRTDNEYLIRVWSKYKEGMVAGRSISTIDADDEKLYSMIQELKGSDAPDLAIGIQKNFAMKDDVFEDLNGYLDQSVMDKQFANIIEAARINGKQYFLPVTLEIEGLVVDASLIKNGTCGITFEEFDRMIENDLDGFSPYDYPCSEYYNKKDFILSCIDTKAAIEGGNSDFGTDQFKRAVEYAEEHFAEDGFTNKAEYVPFDEELKRERTECRYDRLGSYLDFIHACKTDEGEYTIIGTPSTDASGPRFRALETISVTAQSDVKEGCKKFLNFLFGGAGYTTSDRAFQNIITNREIMARNVALTTEMNNTGYDVDQTMKSYMTILGDYGIVYGYKHASAAMEDSFIQSLSAISRYYYDDPVITVFLVEEIAPYYAGDRTLDEAVKILNERTDKYIKES